MRQKLKQTRKAAGHIQLQDAERKNSTLDRAAIIIACITIALNVLAYLDKIVSFVRWLLSCLH